MAGCRKDQTERQTARVTDNYYVVIMDSCEYIEYTRAYGFQHKGNCKFCEQRRKQELKDLVKQIKGV